VIGSTSSASDHDWNQRQAVKEPTLVSENHHAVAGRLDVLRRAVTELASAPPSDRAACADTAIWHLLPAEPSHARMSTKRRLLLGSIACAALPCLATTGKPQAPKPKPLLTLSGLIGRVNNVPAHTYDFSEAELLRLATTSITTSTLWTPTSVFVGPLVIDVMRVAGVTSGTLIFRTLGDYSAPVPWEDLVRYGVILAHSKNGHRLNNKRWGPLWTIYPRDQYSAALRRPIAESRFIWQVDRIEVRA